jgi:hypothetical protein
MRDCAFATSVRQRKNQDLVQLHNDENLENPYILDYLLNTYYNPFENAQEKKQFSGVAKEKLNCYTDESYIVQGRDILYRFFKALLLKQRIFFNWINGGKTYITIESWRKTYEGQLDIMGITLNRNALSARLLPLKFEESRQLDGEEFREKEAEDENQPTSYESREDLAGEDEAIHRRGFG